jgi:hypothetical protein
MKKAEPSAANRMISWLVLVLIVGAVVVAFSAYIGSLMSMPWWQSAIGGVLLLLALVGYAFGLEAVYQHYSKSLGLQCELRPVARPVSVRDKEDLVITGKYLDRAFTLYRETDTPRALFHGNTTTRTRYGVLEWKGEGVRLPSFSLEINQEPGSGVVLERASPIDRATAGGENASDDVPSKAVREELALLISKGRIEAAPGLLVVRQETTLARNGFPLPWEMEEFLKRGEKIRSLLMPG